MHADSDRGHRGACAYCVHMKSVLQYKHSAIIAAQGADYTSACCNWMTPSMSPSQCCRILNGHRLMDAASWTLQSIVYMAHLLCVSYLSSTTVVLV